MERYEYEVRVLRDIHEEGALLSKMGFVGWELCAVLLTVWDRQYYFKRKLTVIEEQSK